MLNLVLGVLEGHRAALPLNLREFTCGFQLLFEVCQNILRALNLGLILTVLIRAKCARFRLFLDLSLHIVEQFELLAGGFHLFTQDFLLSRKQS